jgi:hypothetical protein
MRARAFAIPALLLIGALLVGGVLGIIAGFVAALLVLDRWLERLSGRSGARMPEARAHFVRMTRERRRAARGWRRRSRPPDQLTYLALETGWAAVAHRRPLGVRTIPLESIVGSVDRHKSVAFDSRFRPPDWSRGRWTLMWLAARGGATLPPIAVYRVGDEHFVSDGHHRVSVARALGVGEIDAEVVDLAPALPSTPQAAPS